MNNLLVTGYRAHELNIFDDKHPGIRYIKKAIQSRLRPLLDEGLEWVLTPGQYGVDLWACEAALELKADYPHLKVSILSAYANPEEKWKEEKQEYYRNLTRRVDFYGLVSKQPYSGVWQLRARDELLLRKSEGALLVYDEEAAEGSPKYMKAAALKKQAEGDYRYIAITLEEIQSIADEEAMEAYE
ncbi:UPF0398 protein YpsA [Paenibacillus sp. J31TS4]|uniref:SLOG family protein n=1 Tax=Paenibacillus sp. J31TS4 TaxID=2807195 RepID=UPI001B0F2CFE|nr:SLOG family protein [Paenibacillus sp. J31TS4]GIP39824.1 UPF0398 protein YpsA [Paenibacillus sp. J31TS4]